MSALLAKTLRSSTLRLALIWIGVFGALVVALFVYVYWSTVYFTRGQSDGAIAAEFAILQKAFARGGRNGLIEKIDQGVTDQRYQGGIYLYVDPSLVPLAGNIAAWPETPRHTVGWASLAHEGQSDMRARFETLPDGSRLLLALPIELESFTSRIAVALALALLLIFVLAAAASVLVTRRTVGRIEAINATSREIMRSGLGQRIPLRGTGDEWDDLAANLNSMLDRIETLVTQVKQVTDNVAHDLRTPLTRMRGRLEKAYRRTRGGDCGQAVIGDALADIDGVLTMFSSLMRISRIEASDRAAGFRSVDLAQIAREVVELFDAAAEEKGDPITAIGDQHVLVEGDRDLLFDAVANLVDNAIKHGCPAGGVTVEVRVIDGAPVILVADRGPGIPAEEFQHVFRRFYRLERSRHTAGNGLGLSLVAAVARLHGVRIEMFDNAPGLGVRLCFPSACAINGERRMPSGTACGVAETLSQ